MCGVTVRPLLSHIDSDPLHKMHLLSQVRGRRSTSPRRTLSEEHAVMGKVYASALGWYIDDTFHPVWKGHLINVRYARGPCVMGMQPGHPACGRSHREGTSLCTTEGFCANATARPPWTWPGDGLLRVTERLETLTGPPSGRPPHIGASRERHPDGDSTGASACACPPGWAGQSSPMP